MCGITGFFRPGDRAGLSGDERAALRRMNDAIIHRGPDEDGFFDGAGVGLAARRLSIIDVATSHQPQVGPSGKTTVVFNGEIYNFQTIREELIALGHELRTNGDTEILPHGYEAWWSTDGIGRWTGARTARIGTTRSWSSPRRATTPSRPGHGRSWRPYGTP
jgi:asparagine synthase (glutamine-hydrolysing)